MGKFAKTYNTTEWIKSHNISGGVLNTPNQDYLNEGTSIFDPVLCEIIYKWFCIDNGKILDPFAGGSVRGIVAGYLGFNYTGIDLRKEQVEANESQIKDIFQDKKNKIIPKWICGNSINTDKLIKEKQDLIFSCPPYFDLEVYSENPEDLSTMDWEKFKKQYKEIIKKSIDLLNENRFAVFVVSDIRDKNGAYRMFPEFTKQCFVESGCMFYNEIILVNTAGSLPIRAGKQFQSGRKVGRMHQDILVFYKGDPKEIKNIYKEIEVLDVGEINCF